MAICADTEALCLNLVWLSDKSNKRITRISPEGLFAIYTYTDIPAVTKSSWTIRGHLHRNQTAINSW